MMRRLKLYAVVDENGDEGYVTACRLKCAEEAAEGLEMRLMEPTFFDYEDDPISGCDTCGE